MPSGDYSPLEDEGRAFVSEDELQDNSATAIEEFVKSVKPPPPPPPQRLRHGRRHISPSLFVTPEISHVQYPASPNAHPLTHEELLSQVESTAADILANEPKPTIHLYEPSKTTPEANHYSQHLRSGGEVNLGLAKRYDIIHLVDQSIGGPIDSVETVTCRDCHQQYSKYGARWVFEHISKDGSGSLYGPLCLPCWSKKDGEKHD